MTQSRFRCYRSILFVLCGVLVLTLFLPGTSRINQLYSSNWRRGATPAPPSPTQVSLAAQLERAVRVICLVVTTPKYHETRAIAVKQTWGKRCNRLIFVTAQHDDQLGETIVTYGNDSYEFLWGKTREALRHIYQRYRDEADWFMKADDDSYVFVENLRYFLYAYSPEMPIYFGHKLKYYYSQTVSYISGSGYVLSSEALRRFVEVALKDNTKCRTKRDDHSEDVEVGMCLQSVGVLAGDSRDTHNRQRFVVSRPHFGLIPHFVPKDMWYFAYTFYHPRLCADCLSEYAITFHYESPEEMYLTEFFNYGLQIYGEEEELQESLPRKVSAAALVAPFSDNSRERLSN